MKGCWVTPVCISMPAIGSATALPLRALLMQLPVDDLYTQVLLLTLYVAVCASYSSLFFAFIFSFVFSQYLKFWVPHISNTEVFENPGSAHWSGTAAEFHRFFPDPSTRFNPLTCFCVILLINKQRNRGAVELLSCWRSCCSGFVPSWLNAPIVSHFG